MRATPIFCGHRATVLAGSAALVLLGAGAVRADVTAEEVWQSWQDYYRSLDYTLSAAQERREGDQLVLEGVSALMKTADGGAELKIDRITLAERDGKVEITLPAEMPLESHAKTAEGQPSDVRMLLRQQGMRLVASGVAEAITYDMTAPMLGLSIDNVQVADQPEPVAAAFKAHDVTSHVETSTEDGQHYRYTASAPSFDYALSGSDPTAGSAVDFKGTVTDLAGQGQMRLPAAAEAAEQVNLALRAGLAVEGSFTFGPGGLDGTIDDQGDRITLTGTTNGGQFDMRTDAEALRYGLQSRGAQIDLASSTLPFPVNLSLGGAMLDLAAPVSQAEGPQPFHLKAQIDRLGLNDDVWSLLDPLNHMPHDPASALVELSGTATLLADLFDPAGATAETAPGELNALDLDALKITLAGAELSGKGGFTFDNTDKTTYAGFPRPLGQLDLHMLGGNRLLETLNQLGLVPDQQAMMVRLMAGLFTRPGPGEDEMSSTLEVREDGGFYANGQKLR